MVSDDVSTTTASDQRFAPIVADEHASSSQPSSMQRCDPLSTVDMPVATVDRALTARVLSFIAGVSGEDFDSLAIAIHAYQNKANPAYRRFVDRLGTTPPRAWTEIPAVPAVAFRTSTLACGPAERVYESSGTTEGRARRARHHVPDVGLYRAAALAGFRRAVLPTGTRRPFIVAAPERVSHPASSLGEMVSCLRQAHDSGHTPSYLADDVLDVAGLAGALDRIDSSQPVLLLALTSALLALTDHAIGNGQRWHLPRASLVLDTGGCKGYATDLPRTAVLERYAEVFAVEPEQVVNEYGMTEMCSQLYARGTEPLRPPPWVRTLVYDPATGRQQPRGEAGLLRHFDLANLGSVIAIQTEDVGRQVDDGIELLGRAPGAEARGCSLLMAR